MKMIEGTLSFLHMSLDIALHLLGICYYAIAMCHRVKK